MNDRREARLSEVAELAGDRCKAPADLLDGYLRLLVAAATGRQRAGDVTAFCRERGADAALRGVPLGRLTALYATAVELAWPVLADDLRYAADLYRIGQAVLALAARSVSALSEGFDASQRVAVEQETTARADFVDDLLTGDADVGRLAERAQRFGIPLLGAQVVAVARVAPGFSANDRAVRAVETAMLARFGSGNVLVAVRESLLTCILAASLRGAAGEFAHQVLVAMGPDSGWQVGVSRPHAGPNGVKQSYVEARETLALADSLGFDAPVLHAANFLVFRVLLRDREAMVDLVETVLSPLVTARTGAQPLLETLAALFSCQGKSAAAARQLGVSVRTVTYRLDRVHRLTGYSATEPTQRFTLEAAVLGARILGWPERPLTGTA